MQHSSSDLSATVTAFLAGQDGGTGPLRPAPRRRREFTQPTRMRNAAPRTTHLPRRTP
ncbi:hypothetical protein LRS74_09770 [Streptomyces sp. LX-29]|uniref:hypothetical protein n=1 Tax=Streptomyces sp. LX-29 TaxID=2900152 RepID=UPI00240CF317|nr:hypothetical protein [Streptomyces sp. LX-29]WFB07303.1 hypothetical protein LRS74_09770 [Streptomyces sp. LX-29]